MNFGGDKDTMRRDRGLLEAELRHAGATIKGKGFLCPFHGERNASGSIYASADGVWRVKCHGCGFSGDFIDVKARAAGRRPEDIMSDINQGLARGHVQQAVPKVYRTLDELKASVRGLGTLERLYAYTNAAGDETLMLVLRIRNASGKTFLQGRRESGGGYMMKAPPKPWPLYSLPKVLAADAVVVCEGEACCEALRDAGVVATTSPGGAGKSALTDWSPLAGKTVYLWPDFDAPDLKKGGQRKGFAHMLEVACQLEKLDPMPRVLWVDPSEWGLPEGGDVVDYLHIYADGSVQNKQQSIKCALSTAEPLPGPATELETRLEETISGKRCAVPFSHRVLSRLSKALLPGTVTCLCGDAGSAKSFFVLGEAWQWHSRGQKVAVFMLEDDRAYHLNRALAQLDEKPDLLEDEWIRQHPDEVRAAYARHRDFLDAFGRRISDAPDEPPTLDFLAEWAELRAAEGCRIIVIDPVTIATGATDKPWIDDQKFIVRVKTAARKHGASIILVTHPRKGSAKASKSRSASLDDLAGGAAYPRFAHTVLWLHDGTRNVKVMGMAGPFTTKINRTVKITKARNGKGRGLELGFNFEIDSLKFAEQGIVLQEAMELVPEPPQPETEASPA